ncbi:hypothetical protein GGX14DRAFT_625484 [Mycena pura]|uniref:F-box domain-containing protein n=1 Tax=Mycena pura TaxID=153505 RepID=A0AAD6YDD9_9AGAR|nr:hypothetical protein GGX14DRAFT_625484 [Mycena pura]
MTTLSSLYEELLQEIGRQASIQEQMALRSVCRAARHAVDPLIFARSPIVVDMGLQINKTLSQLETLAKRDSVWARVGRTLRVSQISPNLDLLWPTLRSLKNIRTVEWTIRSTDTFEAKRNLTEFLKTIDSLEDFILVDKSDVDSHYAFLDVSSNLRKLSVTLERSLSPGTRGYPTAMQWIRTVVGKSPRLEQLVPPSPDDWTEICPILQATGIKLKQISKVFASKELLAYLGSYSGLENLTVIQRGDDDLAHLFFDSLVQHKDSLLSLICSAYFEGEWCLRRYNLHIISQLHALQGLQMNVNSYDIIDDCNIITTFLDMAPDMPALRSICIRATATVDSLWGACGRNRIMGERITQTKVDAVLTKYSKSTDSTCVRQLVETHHQIIRPSSPWYN